MPAKPLKNMVGAAGFEPATPRPPVWVSQFESPPSVPLSPTIYYDKAKKSAAYLAILEMSVDHTLRHATIRFDC